jgi:hypothetical protein
LAVVTVGGNFIDEARCLPWHTVPMFGLHAIQAALACTAVDRLFASVGPVLYGLKIIINKKNIN